MAGEHIYLIIKTSSLTFLTSAGIGGGGYAGVCSFVIHFLESEIGMYKLK